MGDSSMNQYEERLYSVFKSFDVNNQESLDEAAVNRLCDALQLEERGAALVESLFEARPARVTFAQFRSGLLGVLGEPERAAPPECAHSDDDSSGRELEPKFVVGSKRYGRRSRPAAPAPGDGPRAASASRLEGDPRRPAARRSVSAAEARPPDPPDLDHHRLVGRDEALALCRALRMHSIDRHLVERIFDESPTRETSVGDFFDRLNRSLASAMERPGADAAARLGDDADEDEVGVAVELVAEAWERGGVRRPRRLLAELGFAGATLRPPDLERALDDELRAFDEPPDERGALLAAALATARLRAAAARRRRDAAAAERDKLRADVAEANRRAGLLAQEVDDNHARIEAELKANLERASARHAEELRRARDEAARERERAGGERAALEEEAARRAEAEARLRGEAGVLRRRAEEAEARAAVAEEARGAAERAAARAEGRAAEAEGRAAAALAAAEGAAAAEGRAAALARELERRRARADELCAALERRAPAPGPAPPAPGLAPPAPGDLSAELALSSPVSELQERESKCSDISAPPESLEAPPGSLEAPPGSLEAPPGSLEAPSADDAEKQKLIELVKELETGLEAMRAEYEACEEYWGGKLAAERAAHEADARAAADRLADLVARIADFERRLAPPACALPPIPEAAALEAQVADLEAEFARFRREAGARLAAATRRRRGARAECARCRRGAAAEEAAARAEAAARRLAARLAAADALVRELYVENCRLAQHAPRPRAL